MNNISDLDYDKIYDLKYDKILEEEINEMFNDILNEKCYIYNIKESNVNTLIGTGNKISLSNFTYLIPNLFRVCYAQENASIPYICPIYIKTDNIINYFPIIINTNLIKSFIYFNFPGSINDFYHNYNFIKTIHLNLNIKKRNSTYGSYTNAFDIINTTYSSKSLLIQLISFKQYLINSNISIKNNILLNNYIIEWDFIKECVNYSDTDENYYTIGNNTQNNNIISQNDADNLYNIRNSSFYYYKDSNTQTSENTLVVLQNYSIYTILDIVTDVYNDINEEINYYFQNKFYCKKKYMYKKNIPVLLKIYNNYYNNQIYTISKNLNIALVYEVKPNIITINEYVNQFINIYLNTYNNRYVSKTIYLENNIDAIIFFVNQSQWGNVSIGTEINYWYYYINIGNPSAIELFSQNTSNLGGNYNANNPNIEGNFSYDFNNLYLNENPTYTLYSNKEYYNTGLYPNAGYNINTSITVNNVGSVLSKFYNNGILQTKFFLTLQSPSYTPSSYEQYYNSDYPDGVYGIALQYYINTSN